LEGVHPENLANFNFTMFRFVALFAFVAVAAAEPQWGLEHMKTPSGDTVSVQAAKVQHHQMKTAEYVKKGYASPVVYANSAAYAPYSGVPVYNQGVAAPVYNHGVYSYGLHHLGKRDADSDSQYIYSNGAYNSGVFANGYNGYALPKVYSTVAAPVYSGYNGVYNGVYNTYAGIHHLGKRDADSDSQYVYSNGVYNSGIYANGYNGYAVPKVYSTVASPVHSGYNGVYNGVYNTYAGIHHLGKRDADSDSQYIYSNGVYNSGIYANGYNGYAVPKVYSTVASPVHSGYNGVYNGVYNTYAGIHHLGKRDADSDSAMVYSTQFGGYPYTNTATFGNVYNAGVYGSAYPAMSTYKSGVYSSYPSTYYSGYTGHRVFKREAEADSQWAYNNAYTPYSGFTGYTGYTGYAAPYNYGNVWNRAQYVW